MQVHGVLIMTLLEMLQFLVLKIVHHLILTIAKVTFYGINGSFRSPGKKISIDFTKANTTICLSLHYNADNSYLFVNGKKSLNLKRTIKC